MGRTIVKLQKGEEVRYIVWSSVVDAPVTYGLTYEELEEHIRFEQGQEGMDALSSRMGRVYQYGTSSWDEESPEELMAFNRAGEKESCLTFDEIVQKYWSAP